MFQVLLLRALLCLTTNNGRALRLLQTRTRFAVCLQNKGASLEVLHSSLDGVCMCMRVYAFVFSLVFPRPPPPPHLSAYFVLACAQRLRVYRSACIARCLLIGPRGLRNIPGPYSQPRCLRLCTTYWLIFYWLMCRFGEDRNRRQYRG
jgi:hypothetical protein